VLVWDQSWTSVRTLFSLLHLFYCHPPSPGRSSIKPQKFRSSLMSLFIKLRMIMSFCLQVWKGKAIFFVIFIVIWLHVLCGLLFSCNYADGITHNDNLYQEFKYYSIVYGIGFQSLGCAPCSLSMYWLHYWNSQVYCIVSSNWIRLREIR
jgi:hypothetical protein